MLSLSSAKAAAHAYSMYNGTVNSNAVTKVFCIGYTHDSLSSHHLQAEGLKTVFFSAIFLFAPHELAGDRRRYESMHAEGKATTTLQ
jgi:hypothetical protein